MTLRVCVEPLTSCVPVRPGNPAATGCADMPVCGPGSTGHVGIEL